MATRAQEDELILALCKEAGPDTNGDGTTTADWTDEQHIEGFRGNYSDEVIARAADGDVEAIVELRMGCGLPIFS